MDERYGSDNSTNVTPPIEETSGELGAGESPAPIARAEARELGRLGVEGPRVDAVQDTMSSERPTLRERMATRRQERREISERRHVPSAQVAIQGVLSELSRDRRRAKRQASYRSARTA